MTAPTRIHDEAATRWSTYSIAEQMGNIGSEVERAIRAFDAGHHRRFDSALARALELFDLTASDRRWGFYRRREILRAREEFCRLFFDAAPPEGSAEGLTKYFLAFGLAARSGRG